MLTLALIAMLAFGSLLHALLPHQHSSNAIIADSLHSVSSLHKQELDTVVFVGISAVVAVLFPLLIRNRRALSYTAVAIERDSVQIQVRRGIVAYRKFR